MLKQPNYIVTYITHNQDGSTQYANKSIWQAKIVINTAAISPITPNSKSAERY